MLIRSISGVRGITATHLTPKAIEQYARAVHQFLPSGVIILGRDSRPSGETIVEVMVETLSRFGRDIVYCGIVPTPTVQFLVEQTDAVGGMIVTASHNPGEWNGLKFVREDGTFFRPEECKALFKAVDKKIKIKDAAQAGMTVQDVNAVQKHILHNLSLKCIDLNAIRNRKFKVVIDAVNGAGSEALPEMLKFLGCEVIQIHCTPDGNFPRGTEPLPENLSDLSLRVIQENADAGFAVDPDADRLAIVSENGKPLGEEYTLVLAVDGYCASLKQPEVFVTNLSSSLALEKTAERHGCTVERSAVGEINVVQTMEKVGANLGGEGNGGVILKEAHLGRDSMVGVTLVLNRMAQTKEPLSDIYNSMPQFFMVKDKVQLGDLNPEKSMKVVAKKFKDAQINRLDGVKISWDDRWIHLRKSNTEPIVRIYAEASTETIAKSLVDQVKELISQR